MANKFNFSGTYKSQDASYELSSLAIVEFKDSGSYVLFAPALEVYGYGKTISEAKKSFEVAIVEFLEYTSNKKTLVKELKRLGWIVKGRSSKRKFKVPEFSDLLSSNEKLSDIINSRNVKTYRADVPIAIPA